MDPFSLPFFVLLVLAVVLAAEFSNGWTDAPCGTSAAVASGVLTSRQALWVTVIGNFVGLICALFLGAAVAHTIGKGIVQPEMISVASIGIAMLASIAWASIAVWLGLPVSKTHSLLAALAGIGYAQGGFAVLLPASGNWHDSGWVAVALGVFFAILCGSAISWFLTKLIVGLHLHERIPEEWWKRAQLVTVCGVSSGHGFNDGLKYVGIFSLVLLISGATTEFTVYPWVIFLCAVVMGAGTLIGGWRIHRRLHGMVNLSHAADPKPQPFAPYMGVCAELTSAFLIWQTGFLGIPTSTNHAVVSAMAGAKSANGKVHTGSITRITWGWIITYVFCFFTAYLFSTWFL
jgi:PiT family inorganic phosphate transporter